MTPSLLATQSPLALDTRPLTGAVDRAGFGIGWDHAHHGLIPPAELLLEGSPVGQGWLAGKSVFGQRTLAQTRHTRLWLQTRLQAWRLGIAFDTEQVTPNYLAQLHTERCPITRASLQGAPGHDDSLQLVRLNPDAGYAAGNLAIVSARAARAWQGLSVRDCQRLAGASAASSGPAPFPTPPAAAQLLSTAQWQRLVALRSLATPLPFGQAAAVPLAVWPPNRVRVLNAVQGLQALLMRCFESRGWAERCRTVAQWLPEHSLRHDFNLFVGAMAPRVIEAATNDALLMRQALEDAWLQERVQRRWQHWVLSMGESACESLLARISQAGLAGVRTLHWEVKQAVEGWALGSGAPPTQRADVRPESEPERRRTRPGHGLHRPALPARQAVLC